MKNRFILIASILFALCALVGVTVIASADNDFVYMAFNSEVYTDLDPSVEYSNGIIIMPNVYETLTRYNSETTKVDPLLATEWNVSDDGLTWVFQLREDVTFHDGEKMNAEAVKKSLDRTINMGLGASFIWDAVDSIEVTGEYEVTFHLKYAAALDLIASAGYAAYIISPKVIDEVGTDSTWFNEGHDGGSGPYMIRKITMGEEVVLVAYENYWGGWKDNQYKNALVKKVAESSTRRQLIESGEAQLVNYLSSTDLEAIRKNENLTVVEQPTWRNIIGFFNTENEILQNADFRRALSYAFPYEETVVNIKNGMAAQSYGLVPSGMWAHNEDLFRYSFDMDKAKEYIAKSGIDPNGLELEVTFTSGEEVYRSLAQIYQANLGQLGIKLNINEMNWDGVWEKSMSTDPNERQDILIMYWWPDYASPFSWFGSLVHSEDEILFNLSYINNPELDALIDEADLNIATDRAKSEELLVEVQEKVIDQAYFLHILDDQTIWAVYNTVGNFHTNPAYENVVFFYDLVKAGK